MLTSHPSAAMPIDFDESKIDAIFASVNQSHRPGVAVGIAIDGKPVYRKGFGRANIELPIALSPSTRMRIGSTSKHFTALAYMLLCEDGKARLDDPIGRFLPELNKVSQSATMRQLMGNISGLPDACDIKFQFSGVGGRPVTSTELLSFYRDMDRVNALPGTTWMYNNGAWGVLMTLAIERLAGQLLAQVLRERIFQPVGMHDTLLRRWDTDFVPNSATAHMTTSGGDYERAFFGWNQAGEGGIVSTVNDMLRWLNHIDHPRVGSAATWALMRSPQALVNGMSTGYGLGLFIDRYRGLERIYHGGGGLGCNAQMLKVPAARLDIAIMANREDISSTLFANRILDICLPNTDSAGQLSPRELVTAHYRSPSTGAVVLLFPRDGQQIASIGGIDLPMSADNDGVLRPMGALNFLKQSIELRGDRNDPSSMLFDDFGNVDELVVIKPADNIDSSAIEGCYSSPTLGIQATIARTILGLRLETAGRFGSAAHDLECLSQGIWRTKALDPLMKPARGIMSFADDGGGFEFSNALTRSLIFRRKT